MSNFASSNAHRCVAMYSCALFEQFSSVVGGVVRDVSGGNSIIHYLDDFICMVPASSRICAGLLATWEHRADRFGIPVAPEKTGGPSTVITFLGVVLDSGAMERRLSVDKLANLKGEIAGVISLRKVSCEYCNRSGVSGIWHVTFGQWGRVFLSLVFGKYSRDQVSHERCALG